MFVVSSRVVFALFWRARNVSFRINIWRKENFLLQWGMLKRRETELRIKRLWKTTRSSTGCRIRSTTSVNLSISSSTSRRHRTEGENAPSQRCRKWCSGEVPWRLDDFSCSNRRSGNVSTRVRGNRRVATSRTRERRCCPKPESNWCRTRPVSKRFLDERKAKWNLFLRSNRNLGRFQDQFDHFLVS